jgi:hypothetical protein
MPVVYASGRFKLSEIASLVPRWLFVAKPYDPNGSADAAHRQ